MRSEGLAAAATGVESGDSVDLDKRFKPMLPDLSMMALMCADYVYDEQANAIAVAKGQEARYSRAKNTGAHPYSGDRLAIIFANPTIAAAFGCGKEDINRFDFALGLAGNVTPGQRLYCGR